MEKNNVKEIYVFLKVLTTGIRLIIYYAGWWILKYIKWQRWMWIGHTCAKTH